MWSRWSRSFKGEKLKIVNGQRATDGQFPWQVSLGVTRVGNSLYAHFCGGSVYSKSVIITAAHCVVDNVPADLIITAGTMSLGDFDMRRYVKRIIVKSNYDPKNQDNDIAILELAAPLKLVAGKVAPVDLLTPSAESTLLATGVKLRVAGWGVTQENGDVSRVLQWAELPFVSRDRCNEPGANHGQVTGRMLCADFSEGGIDACQGDSGGGLTLIPAPPQTPKLTGIVSWGDGCARPEKYGVYTDVAQFAGWVAACVAALPVCKD